MELIERLANYLNMLPSHARERQGAVLLEQCRAELTKQAERVESLQEIVNQVSFALMDAGGGTIEHALACGTVGKHTTVIGKNLYANLKQQAERLKALEDGIHRALDGVPSTRPAIIFGDLAKLVER